MDLAGVGHINSTGIAVLVALLARARADAIPVSACGLADHYREILTITRLRDFLTISDEAALTDVTPRRLSAAPSFSCLSALPSPLE